MRWGIDFINDYIKLFTDEYSFRNKNYARYSFHVILGQVLKKLFFREGDRFIDIRTHYLLFQPSGSGKGAGIGFIIKICQELGLDVVSFTESTSAALVGSYDHFDEDKNEWIMKEGDMLKADILAMEECGPIFDAVNEYTEMNMNYMQQAMNPLYDESSRIQKKLAGGDISRKPHCSFLLMSYIPRNIKSVLVDRGFLQRCTVNWNDIDYRERRLTLQFAKQKMMAECDKDWTEIWAEKRQKFRSIVRRFQILRDYYQDEMQEIPLTKKAIENAHDYVGRLFETTQSPAPFVRQKLEEWMHRLFELTLRYSTHLALAKLKEEVTQKEVGQAYTKIIRPYWVKNVSFIEHLLAADEEYIYYRQFLESSVIIYKMLQKRLKYKKGIPYHVFINKLHDQWNVIKRTVKNRLKRFIITEGGEKYGYYKIYKDGGNKFISLEREIS